jgi:hypothetical protein
MPRTASHSPLFRLTQLTKAVAEAIIATVQKPALRVF